MNKRTKNILVLIVILIISFTIFRGIKSKLEKNVTYTDLITGIQKGDIKEIDITFDNSSVQYLEETKFLRSVSVPSVDAFLNSVNDNITKGELQVKKLKEPLLSKSLKIAVNVLPFVFIAYLFLSITRIMTQSKQGGQQGMGGMTFGKSKARVVDEGNKPDVRFKDVAGVDEEKAELEEIVDFLKTPEKYTKIGARIPSGVILVGAPGTGKTLLAKALAGEAGVPFFSISGSDFMELYVGVGASRVRDLFNEAKKAAPSIIFIDEIDAVGRQRGAGLGGGHDEREQTLNQLLVEMDGFGTNEGVIVIAATNRPDILDSALLRPGRFDRRIFVSLPDVKARKEILLVHAKDKNLGDDVDLDVIANNTVGMAGADLANVLNEAALLSAKDKKEYKTKK